MRNRLFRGLEEGEVHRPRVYVERMCQRHNPRGDPREQLSFQSLAGTLACCRRPHSAFVNGAHLMGLIHKLFSKTLAE